MIEITIFKRKVIKIIAVTLLISPSSITALLIFLNSSYNASISLTLTAIKKVNNIYCQILEANKRVKVLSTQMKPVCSKEQKGGRNGNKEKY